MKKTTLSLALSGFFLTCSCDDSGDDIQNSSEIEFNSDKTETQDTLDTSKSNFETINKYQGHWISLNYLERIEKEKSVFDNQKYDTKILGFHLDRENLISDAPELVGYITHEGGYSSPIIFDDAKDMFVNDVERLKEFDFFQEMFHLRLEEPNVISMVFQESNRVDKYRKVSNDLDTELRRLILSGKYSDTDNSSKIIFHENGSIENFKSYQFYKIIYDFGLGIEFDAVLFFDSKDGGNWDKGDLYKFEVTDDILRLNYVDTDWNSLEHNETDEVIVLKRR